MPHRPCSTGSGGFCRFAGGRRHQPLVPGGPRKSVVSWGKTACVVGWGLIVVCDGVGTWLGLSFVAGAGGLGALLVIIGAGTIAGTGVGACVGTGALGGCVVAAVLVAGMVGAGMTAPVGSTGSRAHHGDRGHDDPDREDTERADTDHRPHDGMVGPSD
jgi:hypothetical protein